MKNWSLKKKIFTGLLAVLIIMQFFRVDQTNPTYEASADFIAMTNPPADIAGLLKGACYDCHSYETKYPWYFNVAPVSFWLKGHIKGARQQVNFSEWGSYDAEKKDHKIEECVEEIKEKEMPLATYTLTHPEARLTDEQRASLAGWFNNMTVNSAGSDNHNENDYDDDDHDGHDH